MKSRLYLLLALLLPFYATAELQRWPGSVHDKAALENGAQLFVRHCLACHGASGVSQEEMASLGITDVQMLQEARGQSANSQLVASATPEALKAAFGVVPPDLAMIMRSRDAAGGRGADWVYTFLRSYTPDAKSRTGWNNTLIPDTAMPNVLQGLLSRSVADGPEASKNGLLGFSREDGFDKRVSNLVAYAVWMSGREGNIGRKIPDSEARHPGSAASWRVGLGVLFFLVLLLAVVYALQRQYWKNVR